MNINDKLKLIIAFSLIYFVWGSTFLFNAIALKTFSPFVMSTLRFLIGGVALLIYCIYRREPMPSWGDLTKYIITGFIIFLGGVVGVVWAQQFISSSLTSIIITTPFWFVLLDKRHWKANFSNPYTVSGLVLGFSGVILLLTNKQNYAVGSINDNTLISIGLIILGSFCWVSGSLYLKYNPGNTSVYVKSAVQLLACAVLCFVVCLFTHEFDHISLETTHLSGILAVFYLAIASTTLGLLAFIWLLERKPASVVSTYSYVNPIVAVLLGSILLNEKINFWQIVAMFVTLCGVLCVNIPQYNLKFKKTEKG